MITNKAWQVACWAVDGIGLKTYRTIENFLLREHLSWADWWSGQELVWTASGLKPHQQLALRSFQARFSPEAYHEYVQQKQIWVITENDAAYPSLLKATADHPPVLFGRGAPLVDLAELPMVAVVGTRRMSSYGEAVTRQLVSELVAAGIVIVSGFMYGVDVIAHQAADLNQGKTIGVLGFGFDHMYPSTHSSVMATMIERGQTFVTEYAPHVRANKGTFVCRNRLVAGLSQAVVVTEAALKSGSHITVRWALEYGRSVGAVPGSIANPYSQGTKWLINQGATLVTSAADILDEIGLSSGPVPISGDQKEWPPQAALVLQELKLMSQSASQLASHCQASLSAIFTTLTYLELHQKVKKRGDQWSLC